MTRLRWAHRVTRYPNDTVLLPKQIQLLCGFLCETDNALGAVHVDQNYVSITPNQANVKLPSGRSVLFLVTIRLVQGV